MMLFALCMLCFGGASALLNADQQRQSQIVRNALRHADMPLDKAAIYADVDVRQLSREIDGLTGTLRHLFRLPPAFLQWFGAELIAEFGYPEEVQRLAEISAEVARIGPHKRMVKVTLPLGQKEQVS